MGLFGRQNPIGGRDNAYRSRDRGFIPFVRVF
jgi:hypothetical protein